MAAAGGAGDPSPSQLDMGRWYMSRKELEDNCPSRADGIDLKRETHLRKSYCTFLQDLGMRLKVPQVTIATAIIFCHRFFLRQSHAKNDRRTVATACMFLAGKVEETPRPLKDVIVVSYEIIHKKDPAAPQRIKQKVEVCDQQKELILHAERVVLATLGFDLNILHPYKPLVEAIKKFKVAQNALAQVAWNFVNDGLRTSLCLQFKPHHIAAGAIFLAAKFLKVKLPSDGERVWWQEFDVTPRQLEEVSNQMLELYEQNRVPPSQSGEMEGSSGVRPYHKALGKTPSEEPTVANGHGQAQTGSGIGSVAKPGTSKQLPHHLDDLSVPTKGNQDAGNDNGSTEMGSDITDHQVEGEVGYNPNQEPSPNKGIAREDPNRPKFCSEIEDGSASGKPKSTGVRTLDLQEGRIGKSPQDVIKMIDKDKVKARLEKTRQARADTVRTKDLMDEDDLIERELEDGIEMAAEDEKLKNARKQNWTKTDNSGYIKYRRDYDGNNADKNLYPSFDGIEGENAEEGEMVEDVSPILNSHKRKAGSPLVGQLEGKHHADCKRSYHSSNHHSTMESQVAHEKNI
ncbi:Cyclin, N-terminal [Dillenia turbinata]|uniref:Cyclin, N-terminal n=1 Tax=Dillenia turbinata TaxID=194707 RepID=A0AAN8USR9_9MAGN